MKFRLPLLATLAMLLVAPFVRAENCNTIIIDKPGVIRNPAIVLNAARPLINQGADVKVVIVDSIQRYGSDLAAVETYFETSCPSWVNPQTGQRKANLFVIMVAPTDRAKNMFLGSYYNGAFDVTSTYSQFANPFFKNHQWEDGIAAALRGTTGRALAFRQQQILTAQQQQRTIPQQRAYTQAPVYPRPTPTQTQDSGMSGLAIFFIVPLVLGVFGTIAYLVFRASTTTTPIPTDYDTSVDPNYVPTSHAHSSRSYAAAAPSHTTIINNGSSNDGLLTGVLVGEALSRNNNPAYVPPYVQSTVYTDPTPSYVAPTQDAPDSTFEAPQDAPDTSFSAPDPDPSPSYDPPSSDFGGGDSGFSGGDSGGSGDSGF